MTILRIAALAAVFGAGLAATTPASAWDHGYGYGQRGYGPPAYRYRSEPPAFAYGPPRRWHHWRHHRHWDHGHHYGWYGPRW